MAIVSSTIKVYDDAEKTTLLFTVTGGAGNSVVVNGLDPGTSYWATVTATDDTPLTSDESPVYQFFSLPNIEFAGPLTSGSDWFSAEVRITTDVVGVSRVGLIYDTSSDFSNPQTYEEAYGASRELRVTGLEEHTVYYVKPYLIDQFGRYWENTVAMTTVTTGYSAPVVTWTGLSALGSTTFTNSVNVQSTSAVTAVYVVYRPIGGSATTVNLTATTGTQPVSLSGLTPNTTYEITAYATNASGTGQSTLQVFTTNALNVLVDLINVTVSNENNVVSVESKASYDSNIITITGHWVDLYENDEHKGTAFESVSGGANAVVNLNLSHANPDETYFVFGRVTYTVAGDATEYTAWSEPWETLTYSLFSFGSRGTDGTTAKFDFSVVGDAQSTVIEYSTDQANWTKVAVGDPNGETILLNGLDPDTTYYFKGRTKSAAGWSGYDTMTLTTGADTAHQIVITSVTNITSDSAIINVTIS